MREVDRKEMRIGSGLIHPKDQKKVSLMSINHGSTNYDDTNTSRHATCELETPASCGGTEERREGSLNVEDRKVNEENRGE